METVLNGSSNGEHKLDVDFDRFLDLVANDATSRSELVRRVYKTMDPRRNIDDECGYPSTGSLSAWHYQEMYDREPVAARVVQVLPKETWKVSPTVYESEKADVVTPFEEAWDGLAAQLRGGSWFRDEQGSPIWEYLQRADILSGIGHFGVIFLGIDDGLDYDQPAALVNQPSVAGDPVKKRRAGSKPSRRLTFIRVFPETLVQISESDADRSSPRFGQPVMYTITLNDPNSQHSGIGLANATIRVHWTRIVHIAETAEGSSEVYAVPRMRPVLNPLLNLRKVLGAGAEGYWKSCFTGLSFETNPQLGGNVSIDVAKLRDMYEKYINGLDRSLVTSGMVVKTLAPSVVDPTTQVKIQIEAICIKIPIPMRVFMGSERGELASSQDSSQWDDTVAGRQNSYATPKIIVPFVDRLIMLDVLPVPEDGYSVEWPDLTKMSAETKAKVAGLVMTALAGYVSGNVSSLLAPVDALTKILGWDEEEVVAMLENAAQEAEIKMEQEIEQQEGLIARGLAPDPTAPPVAEPVEEEPDAGEPVLSNVTTNWCNQHGGDTCKTGADISGKVAAVDRMTARLGADDRGAVRKIASKVASKLIDAGAHLLSDAAKEVADDIFLHVTFNKMVGMPAATMAWQLGALGAAKGYLAARKAITGNELEVESWRRM